MSCVSINEIEVIAPNFKKRFSGVTATIVHLVPLQKKEGINIAAFGASLPNDVPTFSWGSIWKLWKNHPSRPFRIWHARRNSEMLIGIIMRDIFRMKLRLVFTSASQRYHKAFTKWLIRKMDRVIATSNVGASYLKVPFKIIMHGIDIEHFTPPKKKDDYFSVTGLPGRYAVGCFGRIRYQKGTDLFIDAMIALLPHYPEWTAVFAGRTTYQHLIFEKQIRRKILIAGLEKRIVFLNELSNPEQWYRRLTLYVAPSRHEGFGLTPLEAMASQTAVVASNVGVYDKIVVEGTGSIVPKNNGTALQNAIEFYLANPERALIAGRYALEHIRHNFPLRKEAVMINSLYEDLFKEKNQEKSCVYSPFRLL